MDVGRQRDVGSARTEEQLQGIDGRHSGTGRLGLDRRNTDLRAVGAERGQGSSWQQTSVT